MIPITRDNIIRYLPAFLVIVIYLVGIVGMSYPPTYKLTRDLTPANLLFCLTIWGIGFSRQSSGKLWPVFAVAVAGFLIEVSGVHFNWIFGPYHYEELLGPSLWGVPLLMSANWLFMVSGSCEIVKRIKMPLFARIIAASVLMVGFDVVMEPVAIKMGFWTWEGKDIPLRNFFSWGLFAMILNWIYLVNFKTTVNNLAVLLFFAQLLFFISLQLWVY